MGLAGRQLRGEFRRQLIETSKENRRQVLLRQISLLVTDLLGGESPTVLTPDQRIFELGVGSLQLVELKSRLEAGFDVELPVILFFKYAALGELGDHLLTEVLGLAARRDERTQQRPSPDPRAVPLEERLAVMSEQQAEAELLRRIASLEEDWRL